MLRIKPYLLLLSLPVLFLCACSEIFEESIEKDAVIVYTPSDSVVNEYVPTFWWEKIDNAIEYQVRIVSPSFSSPTKLILDTITKNNKLTASLSPGHYQWQVRGMNGSSNTEYATRSFRVATASLGDQPITLIAPDNNTYLKTQSAVFSWQKLFGATGYRIQVDTLQSFSNQFIINTTTPNIKYTYSLPRETKYFWRIMAYNNIDSTDWSNINEFTVDITAPAVPALVSPAENATNQPLTPTIKWQDMGSGHKYKLHVIRGTSSEVTYTLNTNTYQLQGNTAGQTTKWRVQAIDPAGNEGALSQTFTFTIQ